MFGRTKAACAALLLAALVVMQAGSQARAEDAWRVSKSSGEVSLTTAAGEQTPLTAGVMLQPGDNVRTGQNGRVLLVRGEETILISPNSSVGIPKEKKAGLSTTIIQQSGSILLEVEKRNVQHFEVATPYLAAVVKGTQFRVSVDGNESRVDVVRGQVQVSDFKTGQFALVLPGQIAKVAAQGLAGLALSGEGLLNAIQQGIPSISSVSPLASLQAMAPSFEPKASVAPTIARDTFASSSSAGGDAWSFAMPSHIFGRSTGRRNATEDITLSVVFSLIVGIAVAAAVGVQRRRRIKRPTKG